MTDAVILVEEESARIVVSTITTKCFPDRKFRVIGHEGKSDLERSIQRKINGWRFPENVPFIILRDNDGGDCTETKKKIANLVPAAATERTKIRIVMQCLEGWYLGDLQALGSAGLIQASEVTRLQGQAKFRNPELITNAKDVFLGLHNEQGQLALANRIAPHMSLDRNRCRSFQLFIQALRAI